METDKYSYAMSVVFDNVLLNSLVGADQATNIRQSRVTLTLKTEYSGPYLRNWLYLSAWMRSSYHGDRPYLPVPYKPDMLTVMSMLIEGTKSHWIVQEDIRQYRAWAAASRAIVVMSGNVYGGTLYLQKFRPPYEIWTKRYYNNFLKLEAVHLVPCVPARVAGIAIDSGVATIDIEFDSRKIIGKFPETNGVLAETPDEVHDRYWVMEPTTTIEQRAKEVLWIPDLPQKPALPCDTGPRFRLYDDYFYTLLKKPITISKQDLLRNDIIDGTPDVIEFFDIKNGRIEAKGRAAQTITGDEFTFVPTGALNVNSSFKYRIINSEGRQSTNAATVTIIVMIPVLEPIDDDLTILENDTLTITWDTLLENDKHQLPIQQLTITNSTGLYITKNGKEIHLTPSVPAYGEAWFEYKLTDTSGYTSPDTARVTVTVRKPQVIVHNDNFTCPFRGTVLIPISVLTSNDESNYPIARIELVSSNNCTATIVGNSVKFVHTGPKGGSAWFSYRAYDTKGNKSATLALVSAILEPPKISVADDTFECLQGATLKINLTQLYANDTHDFAIQGITISNRVNCTVTESNGVLTVTPSATVGQPCSFNYKITDIYGFESTNTAKVTINIYKPLLQPVADSYSVQQRQKLTITFADLYKNDKHDNAISRMEVVDTKNCTIAATSTGLTITPSAIYGEQCWFTYRLIDSTGYVSETTAKVTITITRLPDVTANIYTTAQIEQLFANNYKPPTLQEIFNSWARYYKNYYYGPNVTPQGEAASWQMHTAKNFRCTVNSSYLTGFVSPDKFDTYVHEADFSSTDTDDDGIYLIIAFQRLSGVNHSLMLMRCSTGCWISNKPSNCFGIVYVKDNTCTLIKNASGTKCKQTGGWSKHSPCRVRVTRLGDKIICESAPPQSTNIAAGEKIEINLADYASLAWARQKLPYGYACWSQRYSSFDNVVFEASAKIDMDVIYNGETGEVWRYKNNAWVLTDEKVWDIFDAPRYIENPLTNDKFETGTGTVNKV